MANASTGIRIPLRPRFPLGDGGGVVAKAGAGVGIGMEPDADSLGACAHVCAELNEGGGTGEESGIGAWACPADALDAGEATGGWLGKGACADDEPVSEVITGEGAGSSLTRSAPHSKQKREPASGSGTNPHLGHFVYSFKLRTPCIRTILSRP